jgi:hypothetical protein
MNLVARKVKTSKKKSKKIKAGPIAGIVIAIVSAQAEEAPSRADATATHRSVGQSYAEES